MIQVFSDDDHGYKRWKFAHPRGYVLNAGRPAKESNTSLHEASCSTISGDPPGKGTWTGSSDKVCGDTIAELERWTHEAFEADPSECTTCTPYRAASNRPNPASRPF